jgi:hypothetical protein
MARFTTDRIPLRWARLGVAALGAAVALGLAACGGTGGGGQTDGAGAPIPAGASLVGAATPVFVSVNTDFGGEQWQAFEALVNRFPSGAEMWQSLFSELDEDGIDFETDVKPALGPEVDVAILDLSADADAAATAVVLTRPADPAKLEALFARADGEKPVWQVVDGWYVVSDSQDAIDRALAGADAETLAESEAYQDALGELAGDPLGTVYIDGPGLMRVLTESLAESNASLTLDMLGLGDELRYAAVGLSAEAQGFRVEGIAASAGGGVETPAAAAAQLPSVVPAGALVYVGFNGLDQGLSQLLDLAGTQTPDLDQQLAQAELFLGISIQEDVLPIFGGEGALYVRPASGEIPEVTLVLSPPDAAQAVKTLDKLLGAVGAFAALGDASGLQPAPATVAGVPVKVLQLGEELTLYYGAIEGRLVVTTAESGIADLVGGGARLTDDPIYQEATQATGLPAETSGFAYVNIVGGIQLIERYRGDLGDPEDVANLRSLGYLVAYVTGNGTTARFAGFLGIR